MVIYYNIPEPQISPAFTVEDIHKIREWHYERLKDATFEEWSKDIDDAIAPFIKEMNIDKNGVHTPQN